VDSLFTRVLNVSWVVSVSLAILSRTYWGALAYNHLESASITEHAMRHNVKASIGTAVCKVHAL